MAMLVTTATMLVGSATGFMVTSIHGPALPQPLRVAPTMALAELSDLALALPPTAFGNAPTFSSLPLEMPQYAPHPKFSHTLMGAVGAYTLLNAVCTFSPVIKRRLAGEDSTTRFLLSRPEASFGWLQADLRNPLPALSELTEHPIGFHNGKVCW